MRLNSTSGSWLGVILILAGVLLGLFLSASVTWGESEAVLYSSLNGDRSLSIKCPLMLARDETGSVTAKITNLTNDSVTPTVSVEISHADPPRQTDQIVTLTPGSSQTLTWSVDSSDVIFSDLILVNILQLRYRDNPSMLGSCGILLFSLFGLSGQSTFILLTVTSLAAMLGGAFLWARAHQQMDRYLTSLANASIVLTVMTALALLTTLPRWWGLTLIFDAGIVLMIGVIFTEFVLFPGKYKS